MIIWEQGTWIYATWTMSIEWSLGYFWTKLIFSWFLIVHHLDQAHQNHHHHHPHLTQPHGTSPSNTTKHNWQAPWHAANRPGYRRWAKGNDASIFTWVSWNRMMGIVLVPRLSAPFIFFLFVDKVGDCCWNLVHWMRSDWEPLARYLVKDSWPLQISSN